MDLHRFVSELRRRKVFRVGGAYAALAFVLWQAADIAFPALGMPAWTVTAVVVLTLLGFPVALVLAWAFDITPAVVSRTDDEPAAAQIAGPAASLRTFRIAAAGGVLALALGGGAFFAFNTRATGATSGLERSLAVLPFENLSGDPDNEYFSDGITEDILVHLAGLADLQVISRSSVMAYKQAGRRPREVGAELGVAHVVEGSVRRDGTRVRIAARLVEAQTERQLWADTWDRELTDVFRIQAEIAQQIAHALRIRLSPAETARLAGDETVDPEAYDRFLRGRELVLVPTEESRLQGIALLREAVRMNPDFAAAHAQLSRGFTPLHRGPTREELDSAMAYAQRAIALAPDQVHGYIAQAAALRRSGRHEEAARIYQRAYELSPGDAVVMGGLGWAYAGLGRLDESLRWRRRAVALDPTAAYRHRQLAMTYAEFHAFDAAEAAYLEAVRLAPGNMPFQVEFFGLYLRRGDLAGAEARLQVLRDLAPESHQTLGSAGRLELLRGDTLAAIRYLEQASRAADRNEQDGSDESPGAIILLGYLHWLRGERQRAEAVFRPYQAWAEPRLEVGVDYAPIPYGLAVIHSLRGDAERALALLDHALALGLSPRSLDEMPLGGGLTEDARYLRRVEDLRAERARQRERALQEGLLE
jgi:TolB-like protein/Flp pilus assembly protein TadD